MRIKTKNVKNNTGSRKRNGHKLPAGVIIGIVVVVLGVAGMIVASAIKKPVAEKEPETETVAFQKAKEVNVETLPVTVKDFKVGDATKIYMTVNGEDRKDITDYVVSYSDGSLSLNPKGVASVFGLRETGLKDEEVEDFDQKESAADMMSADADYLKFTGDHDLIMKVGTKFYLADGKPSVLSGSVVDTGTDIAIPIDNLVFTLGYSSLGLSVDGDSLVYTLIKN